ncbi:unnamed protein product [Nippostrongylus brasiliensis]|uniref:Uncharacterized protein n=1 Tax=Nippostrongylus brasiliensis TaxID=27835 RepID=A0A0N4Y726_NIPBR|nr:unnamed protein product [Nippostrongylus brasiliensis]
MVGQTRSVIRKVDSGVPKSKAMPPVENEKEKEKEKAESKVKDKEKPKEIENPNLAQQDDTNQDAESFNEVFGPPSDMMDTASQEPKQLVKA